MTDHDLAVLQCALYGNRDADPSWDHWWDGTTTDGIVAASKRIDGVDCVGFRGSLIPEDWRRDALAFAIQVPLLGKVHPGFNRGTYNFWKVLKRETQGPWVLFGHSLGAARAYHVSAYMVHDLLAPRFLCTWGCPKPGFIHIADITRGIPGRSYRARDPHSHRYDLVTAVPLSVPPENYVRDRDSVDVWVTPEASILSRLDVFALHHFGDGTGEGYAKATPATEVQIG